MLTSQGLMKVKSKAVRKGIWYEALSRTERAIVDLTIKCVEHVRSPILTKTITGILGKIVKTLERGFLDKAQEIGNSLAQRLSELAGRWGNKNALIWQEDNDFVKFLGVMSLNT